MSLYIGLWTVEDVHRFNNATYNNAWYDDDAWDGEVSCVTWDERSLYGPASAMELDGAMTTARVFSLFAALLSLIAYGMILVPCCVSFHDPTKYAKILSLFFVMLGVLTILGLVCLYCCQDCVDI